MAEEFKGIEKAKRKSAWRGPLLLIAAFILAALIMSLFFRVKTIEVVNASEYTDREIIEASGLNEGDNLFFVDRFNAASLIFSNLEYMDTISIQRSLPNKIIIQASGAAPACYLEVDGVYWLMTRDGKILDSVNVLVAEEYPEIRGLQSPQAVNNTDLIVSGDDVARLAYACDVISAVRAADLESEISYIDVSLSNNPLLYYQDRLYIYFGPQVDTPMRLAQMLEAISVLDEDDSGTLTYAEGTSWNYAPD